MVHLIASYACIVPHCKICKQGKYQKWVDARECMNDVQACESRSVRFSLWLHRGTQVTYLNEIQS